MHATSGVQFIVDTIMEAAKGQVPAWSDMPMRALIGDPFDLRHRFVMPAIETLTLRRDRQTGNATVLLHWRDPAKVATAAGIYGLIPAGGVPAIEHRLVGPEERLSTSGAT